MTNLIQSVDELIADLERQKAQLELKITVAKGFRDSLGGDDPPPTPVVATIPRPSINGHGHKMTGFQKMREFFTNAGNVSMSIDEIVSGTGMSRGSVTNILYSTHTNHFAKSSVHGTARRKEFRLR